MGFLARRRFACALKWCAVMAAAPVSVLLAPVCCCVRNPAAPVLYGDDDDVPTTAVEMAAENVAVGACGLMAAVGCRLGCCCIACCLDVEPADTVSDRPGRRACYVLE